VSEILIKNGLEFSEKERFQITESLYREFKVPLPSEKQLSNTLFFLLVENDEILSMGGLLKTEPVIFNGEIFHLLGFVNVISNVKNKGYGKQVVANMKEYLISQDITGIGFCKPHNQAFYNKCGFTINSTITPRFVYFKGNERITNQDGQYIFYQDSSDNFMKKVLSDPKKEVNIPSVDLW